MSELQPNNQLQEPVTQVHEPVTIEASVLPTPEAKVKALTFSHLIYTGLFCIVISAAVGVFAARYFVANAPQKSQMPQVMVLDAARITDEAIKANPTNPQKAVTESIAVIKEKIKLLTSMGIIVIDRSSVIEAPEGAFINVINN